MWAMNKANFRTVSFLDTIVEISTWLDERNIDGKGRIVVVGSDFYRQVRPREWKDPVRVATLRPLAHLKAFSLDDSVEAHTEYRVIDMRVISVPNLPFSFATNESQGFYLPFSVDINRWEVLYNGPRAPHQVRYKGDTMEIRVEHGT